MTLTPEQLEARRKYIGASDVPKILGVSPFGNAADVYWSKKGIDTPAGPAAEWGTKFEPALLDEAEVRLGRALSRDIMVVNPHDERFCANLDAAAKDSGKFAALVEAKAHGLVGQPWRLDEWSDEQVPQDVMVQAHAQMWATDMDHCFIVAFIPVTGFVWRTVERSDNLVEAIEIACGEFWDRHVLTDTPPDDIPSIEVARRLLRTPGKAVAVDDEIVRRCAALRRARSILDKTIERADAELLATMGDAEIAENEVAAVTYREVSRKGYTVEPKTYRRLDIRPKKGVPMLDTAAKLLTELTEPEDTE